MSDSTIPGRERGKKRVIGGVLTVLASATIAALTLFGVDSGAPPAAGAGTLFTDVVLNLVLFIPLGIGLALLGCGIGRAAMIGTVASALIESAQYFWLPSRDAALHDVLTNGIGTFVGALLVHSWPNRRRWWRIAGPALALGAATIWIGGGALVQPIVPQGAVWYGFWKHQLGSAVEFPGQVLDFTVAGVWIPDGLIDGQDAFRERIARSDHLAAVARIVLPPSFIGRAQLVGIMSPSGEELVSLWQEGDALLARLRLLSSSARLRAPWFELGHGLEGKPGDTLTVALDATRTALHLRVRGPGAEREVAIPLSAELLWASFVPWDYPIGDGPPGWPLLAAAILFALIGLGLTRHAAAAVAVTLLALGAPSLVLGAAGSSGLVVGLALLAALGGHLLGGHQGFRLD